MKGEERDCLICIQLASVQYDNGQSMKFLLAALSTLIHTVYKIIEDDSVWGTEREGRGEGSRE